MMLTKSYTIAKTPPQPMSWDTYKGILEKEWRGLLDAEDLGEHIFQRFFEENPCMLPGAHGLTMTSGHFPYYAAVFTQPVLPGFHSKVPDFMWLSTCSDATFPVLIEIEKPSKKWFTQKGIQSADLTQALTQISEWKTWFDNPINVLQFQELYIPNSLLERNKKMIPLYLLIYGRRDEANRFQEKRANLKRQNEFLMTYDRLTPQRNQSNYLCIRRMKEGFVTINVPAPMQLGPLIAGEWRDLKNIDDAIKKNKLMSRERRLFLMERISYWVKWADRDEKGIICTGDWE